MSQRSAVEGNDQILHLISVHRQVQQLSAVSLGLWCEISTDFQRDSGEDLWQG